MDNLRLLNKQRKLRSSDKHRRGFVVYGRRVPGVAAKLGRLKFGGDRTRKLSIFAPGQGSGCRLLRSNTRSGAKAHARICDVLTRGLAPPKLTSYADVCARAAMLFAFRNDLVHDASELVICNEAHTLATRFDALFVCGGSERELVSWKTGCGPRFEDDLVHHKAQLAMEWHMLETEHAVPVRRATLVYVGALQSIQSKAMAPIYQAYNLTRKEAQALREEVEQKLAKRSSKKKKNKKKKRK